MATINSISLQPKGDANGLQGSLVAAVSSGPDPSANFSASGILGRLDAHMSMLRPTPRASFLPRDFLFLDEDDGYWSGGTR
ncbi:hypothetical protein M4J40_20220 [Pleomorphomonas sp. NRK JP5]|nr:hypothetical protein [Pleomorphomonas sp. JP5]